MSWNELMLRWGRDGSGKTQYTREGQLHTASSLYTSVAGSAEIYAAFVTGDLPVVFFERNIGRSGAGVSATIFRNSTYTGGTPVPTYNTNDLNPVESTVNIYQQVTLGTLGEQTTATAYAVGNITGSGQGGIASLGNPVYIQPNTIHLLRITNLDTSVTAFISAEIAWYEGYL